MKKYDQKFILSPEWSIRQSGKSLLISGGADALYEIELVSDGESFFSSLKNNEQFTKRALSPSDMSTFEELLTAEVIKPATKQAKKLKLAIIGDKNELTLPNETSINAADVALVVRTTSTYAKLLEKIDYQNLSIPHLLVDSSFHHTLSIGPLVYPGDTACIACLQGRVSTRWGDPDPPASPRVASRYASVTSELVQTELARIGEGDTSLVNKTISWDFQNRTTKTNQLLKVPVCPICNQNESGNSGALVLPWGKL